MHAIESYFSYYMFHYRDQEVRLFNIILLLDIII